MKMILLLPAILVCALSFAQQPADTSKVPTVITLEQALQIALSENVSVKVADKEIEKTGYARKGTYSSLFPSIDLSGTFQRTIKKQVMSMDFGGQAMDIEVGRWNTFNAGVSASMPLVNAQLWETLKISDRDVELAVEKARGSRLGMITAVKESYFACLLARESFRVYKSVYENALENLQQTQRKYAVQRASDLDLARSKTSLANAIPNVYEAEGSCQITLWQLKAVMGVNLDENIDIAGNLADFAGHMLYDMNYSDTLSLNNNSSLRQLAIQADQLASAIKLQKASNLPSLALSFSYSYNAMEDKLNFSEYSWVPSSYAILSLNIPIFAGGKRSNAIKQAKVQATELELQRSDTERQLRIGIRSYLNAMEKAMKSYSSAESAVVSAEKAYDIASMSYEVGRSTLTDLNDAQLALTQARMSVAQAIYTFVIAKANLEEMMGEDFVDDNGNVKLNETYR